MSPPAKVKGKGDGRKKRRDDGDTATQGGDDDDWTQHKTLVKPEDQLDLTEAELKEEITRILTANNPHAPQNIVRFSFKERAFKSVAHVDQLAVHFQIEGNLLHKDSDEAKRQLARQAGEEVAPTEAVETAEAAAGTETQQADAETGDKGEEPVTGDGEDGGAGGGAPKKTGETKLTNQFNFSERAAQTYDNAQRERMTATEPPPRANFSATVTQWEIFDSYQADFERQQREKEKEAKKSQLLKKDDGMRRRKVQQDTTMSDNSWGWSDDISKIQNSSRIIERMVNQNTYDEVSQDFKYWEDLSDDFRDNEGTLLPLWKFSYEPARKLAVTSLCWSNHYPDLFAASFGSYDFLKQTNGLVLMYTLKNPSFPEFRYHTEVGVMCIDLHPDLPYLCAAGYYDGSVAVFNVTDKRQTPQYISSARHGKHTDPVWQVKWQKNDIDNNLNFYSISSDGRVVLWALIKNELNYYDVIKITTIDANVSEGVEGAKIQTLGAGTCLDFHPKMDYLFIVGTEEGVLTKCSKAYGSHFLDKFTAHHMAVYRVVWNNFHPDVFLTCSADWAVKVWDHYHSDPLLSYDLGSPVGDCAWAPYSSSVFAACTSDGDVVVYDLQVSKFEPVCRQTIARKNNKTRLTHLSFNKHHPVLIVGDNKGHITALKLSPNLRRQPKTELLMYTTRKRRIRQLRRTLREVETELRQHQALRAAAGHGGGGARTRESTTVHHDGDGVDFGRSQTSAAFATADAGSVADAHEEQALAWQEERDALLEMLRRELAGGQFAGVVLSFRSKYDARAPLNGGDEDITDDSDGEPADGDEEQTIKDKRAQEAQDKYELEVAKMDKIINSIRESSKPAAVQS